MTTTLRRATTTLAVALAVGTVAVGGAAAASGSGGDSSSGSQSDEVHLNLTPSSAQLADCMPHAKVKIEVNLTTDRVGFDSFEVNAWGLPANTAFTVFLLEQPGA